MFTMPLKAGIVVSGKKCFEWINKNIRGRKQYKGSCCSGQNIANYSTGQKCLMGALQSTEAAANIFRFSEIATDSARKNIYRGYSQYGIGHAVMNRTKGCRRESCIFGVNLFESGIIPI